MKLKQQQSGFTLIELVVVIVILGILAATAIPKFVDLSAEAEEAAAKGVAGSISSALSINYAGCAAKNFDAANSDDKCVKITTCPTGANDLAYKKLVLNFDELFASGGKYKLDADNSATDYQRGVAFNCKFESSSGKGIASFTGISTNDN